jgi:ligand-binding SRPBCC domain-containing protein
VSHLLRRRQLIGGSLEEVFAFFKDPYNLETITPPFLRFRVLDTTDAEVREGTRIRYRLRLRGIPMGWESRITEFTDGVMFADEMLRGPYRRWYHRHLFREVPGGVEMEDIVAYTLPFGPLGRLMHAAVVRRELEAIFDYRAATIARRFPRSAPQLQVIR